MDSDSLFLSITKEAMFYESNFRFRIHGSSIDSLKTEFDFVNDKYIFKMNKEGFGYKIIGDSLELNTTRRDTFFTFSNERKVKRMGNELIVSQKDSIYWLIKIYSLNDNILTVKQLYLDSDLRKMDSITKIKSKMIDSTTFLIQPTRNEFKRFLDLENFGYDRNFKKNKN